MINFDHYHFNIDIFQIELHNLFEKKEYLHYRTPLDQILLEFLFLS